MAMFAPANSLSHTVPSEVAGFHPCYNNLCNGVPPISAIQRPHVEILEQPISIGARFRYKCEGRSAGCIRGVNSTERHKTYPTIRINGYQGDADIVVSCVTKDGPPYFPHPHNLVGKTCTKGVCYKSINNQNNPGMVCSFTNLGIQCVKKKDVKESLAQRDAIKVDPFGTGFSHHADPSKINLNALRLCFQVFVSLENGKSRVPLSPVVSNPIFDNKTISDLTIAKLSHSSSPATGGVEMILLCDQVNKDDIQILFYEEHNNRLVWSADGKFSPHNVHRKAAIAFEIPSYKQSNIQQPVECFIQLRRPSDGAVGKPRSFVFFPVKHDPDGVARKRSKFETIEFDKILQLQALPDDCKGEAVAVPRLIRQAARSKACQINIARNIEVRNTSPELNLFHQRLIDPPPFSQNFENQQLLKCVGAQIQPMHFSQLASPSIKSENPPLPVLKEQVVEGATKNSFPENASDETMEKLSSLDLGIDPSDPELAVSWSNITLDSFSELEPKCPSDKI